MKINVGSLDRLARFIVGCAFFGAGLYFRSWWGLVGIVPIITAVIGFCPAYLPLGINTCKRD